MKKTTFRNQKEKVLNHIQKKRLSVTEAFSRYGIKNLSARISDLKAEGWDTYTLSKRDTGKPRAYGLN